MPACAPLIKLQIIVYGELVSDVRKLVQDLAAAEIGVLDDSFNIDRQRALETCDLLIAQGLNPP